MRHINKSLLLVAVMAITAIGVQAQSKSESGQMVVPRVVIPGDWDKMIAPPSDAIVLFDGKNLDKWQKNGAQGEAQWEVRDGMLIVKAGTGDIVTKQSFGNCQIHVEWSEPEDVTGSDQGRGNSGVFMQGRYEVQVLDSYKNDTYYDGQAGAIYKQYPPLVNAMQKPGKWNVYDIIFKAPCFNEDGSLKSPAVITVLHNGVLVQNASVVQGSTGPVGEPKYEAHGKAPLKLQDHGNPVRFRNIWIREL